MKIELDTFLEAEDGWLAGDSDVFADDAEVFEVPADGSLAQDVPPPRGPLGVCLGVRVDRMELLQRRCRGPHGFELVTQLFGVYGLSDLVEAEETATPAAPAASGRRPRAGRLFLGQNWRQRSSSQPLIGIAGGLWQRWTCKRIFSSFLVSLFSLIRPHTVLVKNWDSAL